MEREVKAGQVYKHFKGFKATIIAVAKHTETEEILVVYKCDSSEVNKELSSNHEDGIYARPINMFLSEVDHDKYPDIKQKYRFELCEDTNE